MVGVYIKYHDAVINERNSDMLHQQIELQHKLEKLLEIKSEAGVAAALLPHLSCSASTETNKMAINIMQTSAAGQWKVVSATIPDNCTSLRQGGIDPAALKEKAARVATEAEFKTQVANGFQYYRDNLWEAAARTWSDARNLIPSSYAENKIVEMSWIEAAQQELERGDYLKSADSFEKGFRKTNAR
jgi:hypothetical protein